MFEKIKRGLRSTKAKIIGAFVAGSSALVTALPAYAAEDDTAFVDGIKTVFAEVTKQVNVANVIQIILIVIGSAIALALFWFGIRYVIRKIMAALKKGKVSA